MLIVPPNPLSRYPFISRRLPAWSVIGVLHVLSDLHVTVAPVAAPLSSARASGVLRVAPVALFQFALSMTPALSAAPIDTPVPTKLMPMLPATLVMAAGLTVTGWPATVIVPVREAVLELAATV